MNRIKIRNKHQRVWRILRVLGIVGLMAGMGLGIFLETYALSPGQLKEEGRYCRLTTEWISDAFAVESWDGVDRYDYYLIDTGDRFMIASAYLDDEEIAAYIDSLYDGEDNYIPAEKEFDGSSVLVDRDLKELAVEELGYWLDMELTVQDYDDYFYPYYLDTVNLGDYDTFIDILLLALFVLLIGIVGGSVSAVKHKRKMLALKKRPYYRQLQDEWRRSDAGRLLKTQPIVILDSYLIVPEYSELVLPLEEMAWFYAAGQGKNKKQLFALGLNGNLRSICTIRDKAGLLSEDYLEQIQMAAPWCRIGYTADNRQAFGGLNKKRTMDAIIVEKNNFLSQKSVLEG